MSTMDRPIGRDDFGREPRERHGDYGESRNHDHGPYRGDSRPTEDSHRHLYREDDRNRFGNHNHKHAWQNELTLHENGPHDFQDPETLDQGIIVRGRVTRIEPYGAFIDFFIGRDHRHHQHHRGLAHISQLADQRVERVEDVVQVDQVVFATVLEIQQQQQAGPRSNPRIRLGLKGVDQTRGQSFCANNSHGTHDPRKAHRAADRLRMFRNEARNVTWRQGVPASSNSATLFLWSHSPSPPPVHKTPAKPESHSDVDSSSENSSSSSSSEESRRRRSRKRRGRRRSSRSSRDRRSSRSQKKKRRRSPSSSESSSSNSSESDGDGSSSSELSKSRDEKRARKASIDDTHVSAPHGPAMDDDDLREAKDFKGAIQGHEDDDDGDDNEEEGPMPLTQSNAAAGGAPKNQYGGALLPGEGQALAQYVQQNLRIPRRGEIGYSADAIDKYEQSGFVMSGSRHARMNAVRIRKENQVYSAEEQRALALITMEENQQKEAQLLQDFRTMLKEKQKVRERPQEDKADANN